MPIGIRVLLFALSIVLTGCQTLDYIKKPPTYTDRLITFSGQEGGPVVLVGQHYHYVLDDVPASFRALQQGPYQSSVDWTTNLLWLSVDKRENVLARFRFLVKESEIDDAERAWLMQNGFAASTEWQDKGKLGIDCAVKGRRVHADSARSYEGIPYSEKHNVEVERPHHSGDVAIKALMTPIVLVGEAGQVVVLIAFAPFMML